VLYSALTNLYAQSDRSYTWKMRNKISAKYIAVFTNIIKCLRSPGSFKEISGIFQEFMKFYEYRGNFVNISGISMRNGMLKELLE
jgi:hypothetical protein